MTTLEKVRRLEQYIALSKPTVDPVLDTTIDKLLRREITHLEGLRVRLTGQLKEFEDSYALKSADFYERYEKGEMGDEIDFIEWSATVDMLANADQQLTVLTSGGYR